MARLSVPVQDSYHRDAAAYDARTAAFERHRRRVVDLLPLRPGDVVLDVGCGTGLCFAQVQDRIGPGGRIVGIDSSAEMLGVARDRVATAGWDNVELVESPVEDARPELVSALPDGADHALFCAVHDVLQSASAVDAVLDLLRPGATVAAGGGKWAPAWAFAVNAAVLALHAPFVNDFAGFDRPWELLGRRLTGLTTREVAMGGGYVASGRR